MTTAYLNAISTAVPPVDVHRAFMEFGRSLLSDNRRKVLFGRMAERSGIAHRWSYLEPDPDAPDGYLDTARFYRKDAFPGTARRMRLYETLAPRLAQEAAAGLFLGEEAAGITHLIVASCTGLFAPGIDLLLVESLGLNPSVERTVVGFMGCYAAMNTLKLARHIVRSTPEARVLVVCIELCSLHMQESDDLEQILSFLLFGDGAAAALVTADPMGFALDGFKTFLAPDAADQITWTIGDQGFDMFLSGHVPGSVGSALKSSRDQILGGADMADVSLWAVHPGGRSILDAVESALDLAPRSLDESRTVLREYGNMSSATILFVLKSMLERPAPGALGCAMAFGPGLTAETLMFSGAA